MTKTPVRYKTRLRRKVLGGFYYFNKRIFPRFLENEKGKE